jgi:hypothetical protein
VPWTGAAEWITEKRRRSKFGERARTGALTGKHPPAAGGSARASVLLWQRVRVEADGGLQAPTRTPGRSPPHRSELERGVRPGPRGAPGERERQARGNVAHRDVGPTRACPQRERQRTALTSYRRWASSPRTERIEPRLPRATRARRWAGQAPSLSRERLRRAVRFRVENGAAPRGRRGERGRRRPNCVHRPSA